MQRISTILLMLTLLTACSSLPEEMVHALEQPTLAPDSELSNLIKQREAEQASSGQSAVLLQSTGWDALAQRLALVEQAEHSIDIQYYIWNSDTSGRYLASRLVAAADRGVRVRVMLDDINLNERENLLAALDAHPDIEIRIFNPIPNRRGLSKWFSIAGDFSRLNRRMHNKTFTVDGAFSVVGGRNIGDEYFDLSETLNFRDLDVLVAGAVIPDIRESFEKYWSSRWSYPIDLLNNDSPTDLSTVKEVITPVYPQQNALPDNRSDSLQYLSQLVKKMHWVQAKFISDNPVPADGGDSSQPKVTARLMGELAHAANKEILLESAYLILDDGQLDELQQLSYRGLEIKALTNSMASNDLITNHSGYAGRRRAMLKNGMQLFELKPDATLCQETIRDPARCGPDTGYGLHSKSVVFDRKISSIGSFNLNLRSTYLNTESVLLIEDESVSKSLADSMEHAMQMQNSWQLKLIENQIQWKSGEETWTTEPETGQWERLKSRFLQLFPIEKYL